MGRAPCCEKMGLNRGPWTPEEDQILVSYVQKHGHTNWRALPKLAGLLRCGKSCRLRWINYLKPDIKRGNFTPEEEDAIINLHHSLGNRWSAIAAKLPGRTDNEIKNVWHTHLKKRLKKNEGGNWPQQSASVSEYSAATPTTTTTNTSEAESQALSPQPSFSGSSGAVSSVSDNTIATAETINYVEIPSEEEFPVLIDESLWSEAAEEEEELRNDSWEFSGDQYLQLDTQNNFLDFSVVEEINGGGFAPRMDEAMDFWYDMLVQAGELKDYEVITLTDVAPH